VPMQPMQPMRAPVNPLGGMDPRPLSSRGGPMAYSQQGVGTTNPNAYAVGQGRAPLGMRLLTRAARRRDPRAIIELARMEQQNAPPPGMSMMMSAPRPQAMMGGANQTPDAAPLAPTPGRDDAFWASQEGAAFMAEQDALRAADANAEIQVAQEQTNRERDMQVTTTQIPGTDYIIPFAGSKAMGTLPVMKAETPLPAGLVPTGAMRGGVQYGPAQPQTGKAPAFTYEKDPSGKITGAVYPVQDPQTGQWKLQRADINGDGVVSPEEAAAVPVAAAAAGAALKTKGGNSYTLK